MTKKMKEKFTVQVVKKKKREDGTVAVSVPQLFSVSMLNMLFIFVCHPTSAKDRPWS